MTLRKASIKRCAWCGEDQIYVEYHDKEWGVPVYEDQKLFECLTLEGAQAGLSWITILKKRQGYRKAFSDFKPEKVACFSERKLATLLTNKEIVRNRLKIESAIKNAKAFLKLKEQFGSFSDYQWQFVEGLPVQNKWKSLKDIPAETKTSQSFSKDLKQRGFSFVGPTIVYSHMQATGMVNDHLVSCFRHKDLSKFSAT